MLGLILGGAVLGGIFGNIAYKDSDASIAEKTLSGAATGAIIGTGIGGAIYAPSMCLKGACGGMAVGAIGGCAYNAKKDVTDPMDGLKHVAVGATAGAAVGAVAGAAAEYAGANALPSNDIGEIAKAGAGLGPALSFTGNQANSSTTSSIANSTAADAINRANWWINNPYTTNPTTREIHVKENIKNAAKAIQGK